MDSSQKELCWGVMPEKCNTLVSQGEDQWPSPSCLPCPILHTPPTCTRPPLGSQYGRPASGCTSLLPKVPPPSFCARPQMNVLFTPASLPLLQPETHIDCEQRPKQETPQEGPESLWGHSSEVGAIPSERQSPCKDPPDLSPTPLLGAPARPTPRKLYTCEQCGLSFDWKSVFIIHLRTHTSGSGLERPSQVAWEPAMRRSPGLRGYICVECGRSFSWKSQLVIHRKSHAGQRRHFCRDCGCSFDWKFQLVIHRKIHQPEGP